jgi:hypothetical protein
MKRIAILGLAMIACATPVHVRTAAAPDAQFSNLHKFIVLATPRPRSGGDGQSNDDPMLQNSITYRALHNDLVSNFQERGYVIDSANPDFAVAAYATARQKLDVSQYDYGYPYWRWRWWGPPEPVVTEYTEGTVVVDVVNPKTKVLLWRGQGVASVSDDPQTYAKDLARTVEKIIERFPEAVAPQA